MPVFFLQYEATPTRGSIDDQEGIAGAHVNCWVLRTTLQEAEEVAVEWIRKEGYVVGDADDAHEAIEGASRSEEAEAYFQQALIDGEVFVFYTYPVEEEQ